ncbi:MAG TPA: helix-hairpin-helix domain-containing protein [Gammaproteobacteria bacterium]|nr:helix-hairpin-helix domain-containing protein [Gammaproteobacteria bacterium]
MFLRTIVVLCLLLGANSLFAAPVNINDASADLIAKSLNGIGPSKAAAIVKFRTDNGPFKSVEELKYVRGISDKILAKIKPDVVIILDKE